LVFDEILSDNPFHKVDIKIKLPTQIPKNISKADLKNLHQTAINELSIVGVDIHHKSITGEIVRARNLNKLTALTAIELLFCTGIRVAELTNIKLQHINIHERKIKIIGKGLRERYVFLSDDIICKLIKFYIKSRIIANPESNFLLTNSQGKKASTHFIRKLIHIVSKKAKINHKITPHMYRHTTASTLLNSGLDIRYVQKILGHQSISTTELYTHVDNKTLQNKVTEINIRNQL